MKNIKLLFALAIIALTTTISAQTFSYDFTTGYDGWTGDFADYPVTDSIFHELEYTRTTLPAPLNTSKYALKITGNNHSDDLFMFIKRKISGLLPNTTYRLLIDVEFASKAPTNAVGPGGPPGEGVTMKAGATVIEPLKINSSGFYLMNIDKGIQMSPGIDMDTIGHVGVSDTTTVFTLINRNNSTHLFSITTDANGEVWVSIGTDSGFEATTTLYYNQITLTFTTAFGLDEINSTDKVIVYPNPSNGKFTIKTEKTKNGMIEIYNVMGEKVYATSNFKQQTSNEIDLFKFQKGFYFVYIYDGQTVLTKEIVIQ